MSYLLSFDVEDWFHAHNVSSVVGRDVWEEQESRVAANTRRLLDLLDDNDVKATFFVLGWVADRHPDLVRAIDDRGHEVASHGYWHRLLTEQDADAIRDDIERSLDALEPLVGGSVDGYRAPSFSITETVADVLAELGFAYDSSAFDVGLHDRYGSLPIDGDSDGTVVRLANGLREVRMPQLSLGPLGVPWAGGGYFRFLPYPLYRRGVARIGRRRDFVFYLHPWELDPDQPRVDGMPWSYRIRQYHNLDRTEDRLDRLLGAFDWEPIGTAL